MAMPPRNPRRILARLGAYRTATPHRTQSRTSAHLQTRPHSQNKPDASEHPQNRTQPHYCRERLGPEGCRTSEHAAIKKAPRLISEESLIAFMKKSASRRVRSHRCRQSPNRAYRPCRSNRNGWHSSTPGLHRPNTSQPGRRR